MSLAWVLVSWRRTWSSPRSCLLSVPIHRYRWWLYFSVSGHHFFTTSSFSMGLLSPYSGRDHQDHLFEGNEGVPNLHHNFPLTHSWQFLDADTGYISLISPMISTRPTTQGTNWTSSPSTTTLIREWSLSVWDKQTYRTDFKRTLSAPRRYIIYPRGLARINIPQDREWEWSW